MNDREAMVEEKREAERMAYAVHSLEQAELAGACLARYCMAFMQDMEEKGMLHEDILRLLVAGVSAGGGR